MSLRKNINLSKTEQKATQPTPENFNSTLQNSKLSALEGKHRNSIQFTNNKTPHKIEISSLKASFQNTNLQSLMRQNELLKEAIKIRDYQISTLKQSVQSYKKTAATLQTKLTTESECDPTQQFFSFSKDREQSKTVIQLTAELVEAKSKNSKSCQMINQLQTKLKQALSKIELNEQRFKEEMDGFKNDSKYQNQEYERILDNIKIQNEEKVLKRLEVAEQRHRREKALFEEQIMQLKGEIFQKTEEILKLNERLKKQKEHFEINNKTLENQNSELRKTINQLEKKHKMELNSKEVSLVAMFNEDIDALKISQKQEIELLCKRIHSLKVQLNEKDSQVKDLWKAREIQAVKLFSGETNIIKKQKNVLGELNSNKVKLKSQANLLQLKDLNLPTLQQYMN